METLPRLPPLFFPRHKSPQLKKKERALSGKVRRRRRRRKKRRSRRRSKPPDIRADTKAKEKVSIVYLQYMEH